MEVRLTDPADDLGGAGYVSAGGVAQSGTTTQIVISNTDTGTNTTYIGMSVYIVSGKGAGQYGYVNTYNSGSKTATIKKHSDGTAGWDHVTGVSPVAVLVLNVVVVFLLVLNEKSVITYSLILY